DATDLVLSSQEGWRASTPALGGPGAADPGVNPGAVVVNEVFVDPADPSKSWIELYNSTNGDVNIGGWFLSDVKSSLTKYQIPGTVMVPANEYKVLMQSEF